MSTESHKLHPTFKAEYTHTEPGGETFTAPFDTVVFGVAEEFLGMGEVVGSVELDWGPNPVIEVVDINDGEAYTLLGAECWWCTPIPEDITTAMGDGKLVVESVRGYIQRMRDRETLSDLADKAWADEHGIDLDG